MPSSLPASRQDSLTSPMPGLYVGMSLEKQTSVQPSSCAGIRGHLPWEVSSSTPHWVPFTVTEKVSPGPEPGEAGQAEVLCGTCLGADPLFSSVLSPPGTRAVGGCGHCLEVRRTCLVLGKEPKAPSLSFSTCPMGGIFETCGMQLWL